MTKKQKYLVSYLLAVLFASFGVVSKTQGASWINQVQSHETEQAITGKQDHKEVSKTNNSSIAPYSQDQYDQLANLDFQSGGNVREQSDLWGVRFLEPDNICHGLP